MATAKQLAALKKARAAKRKNLTKKKPVKKTTTKRKSNPVRRSKYVVFIMHRSRRFYFNGKDAFDTNANTAKEYGSTLEARSVADVLKAFGRDAKVGKKS